jgi:hypothetical protein
MEQLRFIFLRIDDKFKKINEEKFQENINRIKIYLCASRISTNSTILKIYLLNEPTSSTFEPINNTKPLNQMRFKEIDLIRFF